MFRLSATNFILFLAFSAFATGQGSDLPAPVEDSFLQQLSGDYVPANKNKVAHENRLRLSWALGEQFLRLDLKVNFFEATAFIRKKTGGLYEMHWFDSFGTPSLFTARKDPQGGQKQILSFLPSTPGSSFLSRLTLRASASRLEVTFETETQGNIRRSLYHRPAPPGPNKFCPVMDGVDSDPELFVDHEGRRIYFCCEECLALFNTNPNMYLPNLPSRR